MYCLSSRCRRARGMLRVGKRLLRPGGGGGGSADRLGRPRLTPTETAEVPESRPKKTTRAKHEIIVGPIGDVSSAGRNPKSQADEAFEDQEAADRAAETKLTRQLKICNNC